MLLTDKIKELDPKWVIEEITWANLPYRRPRKAGCNARLGVHGWGGDVPLARIRIGGVTGFGWCTWGKDQAQSLIGLPVTELFDEDGMLKERYYGMDFVLLDWLGQVFHLPVYRLVAKDLLPEGAPYTVPVYDTSIYFDELDIPDDAQAVECICREVEEGMSRGHKHFKVKVGRPGMWMPLKEGLKRDIDIILAIRERIGPDGKLMVDANNGYNMNLAKEFLKATASAKLYWLEEAFHEDDQLYSRLKQWMQENGIDTMIADGEGLASTAILDWVKRGLVNVLQYDLRGYGFFHWIKLGRELDRYGALSAPHNYGGFYGNYAQAHFAPSIDGFAFAEWDEAKAEGVDTSAYRIENGKIFVPKADGFGLVLEEDVFENAARQSGWRVGR